MKRSKILMIAALVLAVVTVAWSAAGTMSVQVKNGQIRATPSFLGGVVTTVGYGDQVEALQQQGDWIEVRSMAGRKGWMHQSALTNKRVTFSSGATGARTAASSEELALAGKGFNADVEAQYRAKHRNVDFTWVDKMETIKIAPQEMLSFLAEGGVGSRKGGVQ